MLHLLVCPLWASTRCSTARFHCTVKSERLHAQRSAMQVGQSERCVLCRLSHTLTAASIRPSVAWVGFGLARSQRGPSLATQIAPTPHSSKPAAAEAARWAVPTRARVNRKGCVKRSSARTWLRVVSKPSQAWCTLCTREHSICNASELTPERTVHRSTRPQCMLTISRLLAILLALDDPLYSDVHALSALGTLPSDPTLQPPARACRTPLTCVQCATSGVVVLNAPPHCQHGKAQARHKHGTSTLNRQAL